MNDGTELILMSLLVPIIKNEWGISTTWISVLTSSFYIGAAVGSYITGHMADTYGRRPSIIFSSICMVIFTLAFVVVPGVKIMVILRFFYGFVYGFSFPLTTTMLTEITPKNYRGKSIVIISFFLTLGKILGLVFALICLTDL
jgi:MFS family permease